MKKLPNEKSVIQAKEYVVQLLSTELAENYAFHNLEHTRTVVDAAVQIGHGMDLSPDELECVVLAAWFHDTGYIHGPENHESRSVGIMMDFLDALRYPPARRDVIAGCIQATRMPQNPRTKLEKILCDADLFHLGLEEYPVRAESMRQEFSDLQEREISKEEWLLSNYDFLSQHDYFTSYAHQLLDEGKQANLHRMEEQMEALKNDPAYKEALQAELITLTEQMGRLKKKYTKRGIESMFRIATSNHTDLSELADQKANIMISTNAILLSVLVTVFLQATESIGSLVLPLMLLVLTCSCCIILAVLATRPNTSRGTFTRADIENRQTNLLFFGNFHGVLLEDYEWGMKEMLKDGEYLYSSLIKDLYFIGKVLAKKYRRLRACYTLFMIGIVISVLSFVLVQLIH